MTSIEVPRFVAVQCKQWSSCDCSRVTYVGQCWLMLLISTVLHDRQRY